MRRRRVIVGLPLSLVVALVGGTGCARPQTLSPALEFKDRGLVCFAPDQDNFSPLNFSALRGVPSFGRLESDKPIYIYVALTDCLSGSCTVARHASCTVLMADGVLRITSEGSYRVATPPGGWCTRDCVLLVARCQTPPLPAGTYTIRHGVDELVITVPTPTQVPCIGSASPTSGPEPGR